MFLTQDWSARGNLLFYDPRPKFRCCQIVAQIVDVCWGYYLMRSTALTFFLGARCRKLLSTGHLSLRQKTREPSKMKQDRCLKYVSWSSIWYKIKFLQNLFTHRKFFNPNISLLFVILYFLLDFVSTIRGSTVGNDRVLVGWMEPSVTQSPSFKKLAIGGKNTSYE